MAGNKEFGNRIRKLREEKAKTDPKFTLRKFAESLEISAPFLSRMERGEFDPPAPEKIKKMAELLAVNADDLLKLARKVDPELSEILQEQAAMPDLLRTVRGKTEKELRKIIADLQKKPESQDDKNSR